MYYSYGSKTTKKLHFNLKKKILVTGGAGFIGSHLIDKLLKIGHNITCIDSFDSFYDISEKKKNISGHLNHKNYILKKGDIQDKDFLNKTFIEHSPDVVIHLAAKAGVRPSVENPHNYQKTNVEGTLNLLEASVNFKIISKINNLNLLFITP